MDSRIKTKQFNDAILLKTLPNPLLCHASTLQ